MPKEKKKEAGKERDVALPKRALCFTKTAARFVADTESITTIKRILLSEYHHSRMN